jgi:putative tryptophan/tyrosine transport system substrate-binding protein
MRRREFLAFFAGTPAWASTSRAQSLVPVIGFLSSASLERFAHLVDAFRDGLHQLGFREGQNVTIQYRWANDDIARLPELAAELVERQVSVLVASGGIPPALAAKATTSTIPIVFTAANDPVGMGLVGSLGRPGGNVTGINPFSASLDPKRLELLKSMVPEATAFGVLTNRAKQDAVNYWLELEVTARALRIGIVNVQVSAEPEFDAAFDSLVATRVSALLVAADPLFNGHRRRLVRLAEQHRLPAMYHDRVFAVSGGLMAYGASLAGAYRQAGIYAGRILRGVAPADLPVLQPTNFEFVLNVKTANALGIAIPPTLLARADEVIE